MELGKFLQKLEIPYNNILIYKEAFTHPSYTNENKGKNYEKIRVFRRFSFTILCL